MGSEDFELDSLKWDVRDMGIGTFYWSLGLLHEEKCRRMSYLCLLESDLKVFQVFVFSWIEMITINYNVEVASPIRMIVTDTSLNKIYMQFPSSYDADFCSFNNFFFLKI